MGNQPAGANAPPQGFGSGGSSAVNFLGTASDTTTSKLDLTVSPSANMKLIELIIKITNISSAMIGEILLNDHVTTNSRTTATDVDTGARTTLTGERGTLDARGSSATERIIHAFIINDIMEGSEDGRMVWGTATRVGGEDAFQGRNGETAEITKISFQDRLETATFDAEIFAWELTT